MNLETAIKLDNVRSQPIRWNRFLFIAKTPICAALTVASLVSQMWLKGGIALLYSITISFSGLIRHTLNGYSARDCYVGLLLSTVRSIHMRFLYLVVCNRKETFHPCKNSAQPRYPCVWTAQVSLTVRCTGDPSIAMARLCLVMSCVVETYTVKAKCSKCKCSSEQISTIGTVIRRNSL